MQGVSAAPNIPKLRAGGTTEMTNDTGRLAAALRTFVPAGLELQINPSGGVVGGAFPVTGFAVDAGVGDHIA